MGAPYVDGAITCFDCTVANTLKFATTFCSLDVSRQSGTERRKGRCCIIGVLTGPARITSFDDGCRAWKGGKDVVLEGLRHWAQLQVGTLYTDDSNLWDRITYFKPDDTLSVINHA